jgi:cytochrome c5
MHRHLKMAVLMLLVVAAIGVACAQAPAATTPAPAAPAAEPAADLDGEALVKDRCVGCHDLTRVEAATKTEADWASTVQRMVDKGTRLSEEEQAAIVQYLAATYPK